MNDLEKLSSNSKDLAAINSVKLKLQELDRKGILRSIELIDGQGDAKEALLERLNSKQTDFVLMGSSGKNGFERLYLGSFCEYILRNSKSSLLIVK